jgi:flagellar L-ring protein FlgH
MKSLSTTLATTLAAAALAGLAGCAVTPDSIVVQPTAARPRPAPATAPANGSIFQAASYRPLFEDRRARLVGDILTVQINEKTAADKGASNSASRQGSASVNAPSLFGLIPGITDRLSASASASDKHEEKGAVSSSNNFNGTLTVTVVEVLSNGNMVVSGEKQVALDRGTEFIRFSGVVSPDTVAAGNIVSSTQVADARVEYRTNRQIDKAQLMSMLTRFFLSVSPL